MDVIAEHKGTRESGERFVKYYKTLKERQKTCKRLLNIQFEDLINKYEYPFFR